MNERTNDVASKNPSYADAMRACAIHKVSHQWIVYVCLYFWGQTIDDGEARIENLIKILGATEKPPFQFNYTLHNFWTIIQKIRKNSLDGMLFHMARARIYIEFECCLRILCAFFMPLLFKRLR